MIKRPVASYSDRRRHAYVMCPFEHPSYRALYRFYEPDKTLAEWPGSGIIRRNISGRRSGTRFRLVHIHARARIFLKMYVFSRDDAARAQKDVSDI